MGQVEVMDLDVLLVALVVAVLPALLSPTAVAPNRWPRWRAGLQEFWNSQLHLHRLYLSSFGVSGGDALDALARRQPPSSVPD
jgi:hypothetical protein